MTGPAQPENPSGDEPEHPPEPPVLPRRFGLTTFALADRQAPALFAVGWLATLLGGGFIGIVAFGVSGPAAAVLWVVGLMGLSVGLVLLGGSQSIERRAAGDRYWGPSPLLVFVTILAISRLTGFAVGVPLSFVAASIPVPVGDLIGAILQAAVFLGVVRLMVVGSGALSWTEMGLLRGAAEAGRGLLGGAVFAGPVILVTSLVGLLAVQFAGVTPASPLPPTGTALGLVAHLLAGAVIAPVSEEVVFRGFALTAWRRTGSARRAIVLSSVAFVLAHVLFVGGAKFTDTLALAFVGGVVRIPVAFTLGWLAVRTGSLWGPIGLHAAFNAVLIVLGELAVAR